MWKRSRELFMEISLYGLAGILRTLPDRKDIVSYESGRWIDLPSSYHATVRAVSEKMHPIPRSPDISIQTSVPEEIHRHEVLSVWISAADTLGSLYHPVQTFQETVANIMDVPVQYPVEMPGYCSADSSHRCFFLPVHPRKPSLHMLGSRRAIRTIVRLYQRFLHLVYRISMEYRF